MNRVLLSIFSSREGSGLGFCALWLQGTVKTHRLFMESQNGLGAVAAAKPGREAESELVL